MLAEYMILTMSLRKYIRIKEMPDRFPVYPKEPWKSRKLRRINIGKYSGFYLVSDNTVLVIRIVYGGRNIIAILDESE